MTPDALQLLTAAVLAAVVVGPAVGAVLTVWFEGSLFDSFRARFEALKDDPAEGPRPAVGRFFGELFTCRLCLSYHVSLWLVVLAVVVELLPWQASPFVWLAAQFFGHRLYVALSDSH